MFHRTPHADEFAEPGFALPTCALGVATAATQIEGGHADTTWHRWAAEPGRIADHSTPARAADHWNRVAQDTALLGELGVKHYRMGLEWARLEPRPGEFDAAAFAHYRAELQGLRAAGIEPLVTLHHFNNPGWFEEIGGFTHHHALTVFDRYVAAVLENLGDLVDEWITINEPNIYAVKGFIEGVWPPGHRSPGQAVAVMQAMATAHIRSYRAIHRANPDARVGVANHLRVFAPAVSWNPLDRLGARAGEYLFQTAVVRAMSVGRFLAPFVQPDEVDPGRYYDFQGINYYSRSAIRNFADTTARKASVNDLGWEIRPQGLVEVARWVHTAYPGPIYVTENGTADAADSFRPLFLYDHLRAIAESGLPIERYYHWCFTDNWEWAEGESARFGLVALDFESQQRTVRDSGRFFADIAARGGVTAESYQRFVAGRTYPRQHR